MPVARFQMPDGRIARFEVPEGTTPEQAQAMISQTLAANPTPDKAPSKMDMLKQDAMDSVPAQAAMGAVRGAGSIGATLVDAARGVGDTIMGAVPQNMRPSITSELAGLPRGQALRSGIDGGLQELGANPDSLSYKGGKITAEVAGTSGAGSALSKLVGAIPGVAARAPALLESLRTGGMAVDGAKGLAGLGLRAAGGAAVGGASAAMVDPEAAGTGAALGAAIPVAGKLSGAAMERVGNALRGGAATQPNPQLLESAKEAIEAGYVIPPATVNPTLKNRVLESTAGKMATQQLASAKNQETTQQLVRQALGLPDDAALNLSTLENLRKTAGKAYAEVSALGPQAKADLEALKAARVDASAWFKAYNRSMHPNDLAKAKELRALTDQLETALEQHAAAANRPELIPALRDARKAIAKTYTVERGLNTATGSIDAKVFGRMYQKGQPLSDGLDKVGRFGAAFPSVAKLPEQVGSPDAHNLRSIASMAMGGGATLAAGPLGLLAAAVPYAAPAAARSAMFSKAAQRGLLAQPVTPQEIGLLTDAFRRTAPVLSAQ